MNPFYFGSADRRLFGIFQPSHRPSTQRAALLCHPWGSEYIHAYRSLRHLSVILANAGYHVLRFDYFGTGDSAGDIIEADLRGWSVDIETAVQELADITGARQFALVGLRLGASLAADIAARQGTKVEALVLWDPVVCGSRYLQSLRSHDKARPTNRWRGRGSAGDSGVEEIGGFPLTNAFKCELAEIDLVGLVPTLPQRTLIVRSLAERPDPSLQKAMARRPDAVAEESMPSRPPWIEASDDALGYALPVQALQRIATWLT
jgi:pimeloyl-ACP methyl ester carboxylesterase